MKYIHILSLLTLAGGTHYIRALSHKTVLISGALCAAPAVWHYRNTLYTRVSSLYKNVMSYGWGSHALQVLIDKRFEKYSPEYLPYLECDPYKSCIENYQLPEESKQKIDAIMQREPVMRALTLLYHQPNIVQYGYTQSICWWHGIHFTEDIPAYRRYCLGKKSLVRSLRVFTIQSIPGFYFKMGNLYDECHSDINNISRIINANAIRKSAQHEGQDIVVPQKWFYHMPLIPLIQSEHLKFITPPFLVIAQAIDLSQSQAVPDTHLIRTWFTQQMNVTDLSDDNIRYIPCTTCTKKCTNLLHHDKFTIIDTEF